MLCPQFCDFDKTFDGSNNRWRFPTKSWVINGNWRQGSKDYCD